MPRRVPGWGTITSSAKPLMPFSASAERRRRNFRKATDNALLRRSPTGDLLGCHPTGKYEIRCAISMPKRTKPGSAPVPFHRPTSVEKKASGATGNDSGTHRRVVAENRWYRCGRQRIDTSSACGEEHGGARDCARTADRLSLPVLQLQSCVSPTLAVIIYKIKEE